MYNKMKECNKCKKSKPITEFNPSKGNKDGYMNYCKECHRIQVKKNRFKYKEYDKEYAKKNWLEKKIDPEYQLKHREYQRQYKKQKRKDSIFRLKENLRTYFYRSITNKLNSVFKYLGCSIEEFKLHLEKQFNKDMNWNNYGEYWEVDHINPIENFNFSNESEIYECWNYKNLQPLTINENRTKRHKI
jgi:hypothetical protein